MSGILSLVLPSRFGRLPVDVKMAFMTTIFGAFAMMFGLGLLFVLRHFGVNPLITVPVSLLGFLILLNAILSRTETSFLKD